MAYVKKTLAPTEDYIYRAHFNWTYDVSSWFWFLLGCIPGGLWFFLIVREGFALDAAGRTLPVISAAALLLGGAILLRRYVHKWTTVIAVTSMRLVMKTGLIARDSHEVNLDKIEEVLVHQPFLGRILGYGILTVRGTGIAVIEFPVLARPTEIRREIEAAVIAARRAYKSGGADSSESDQSAAHTDGEEGAPTA